MSKECPPLRFRVNGADIKFAAVDATNGISGNQTARFVVTGFDPRLDVGVWFFFQPKDGKTAPTSGTWTATGVLRDGAGSLRTLATPLFSGKAIPDGFEFDTVSYGIAFDC